MITSIWLKVRNQRLGINGHFSQWRVINSGSLQGSVLVPVLFNTVINDLEKGVNCKVAKFVDDSSVQSRLRGVTEGSHNTA